MASARKQNPRIEYSFVQRMIRKDGGASIVVRDLVSAVKRFQKNGPIHVWYGTAYVQLRPPTEFAKAIRDLQKGADYVSFRGSNRRFSPSKDKPLPFFVVEL